MLLSVRARLQRRMRAGARADRAERQGARRGDRGARKRNPGGRGGAEACAFDPRELERCEERLFALRGMSAQIRRADRRPAGAGAEIRRRTCRRSSAGRDQRRSVSKPTCAPHARPTRVGARALSAARSASARGARDRGQRRTAAAEARARAIHGSSSTTRRSARLAPSGYDRAEFLRPDQSGLAAGTDDEGRLGRRAGAFPAGAQGLLAERGTAPTLVFDEIDTGVGGAVADAIGQRLARLAAMRRCWR